MFEPMARSYTIIDSFRVTEALSIRSERLQPGTWFVLDGRFVSVAELPPQNASVVVVTPSGEQIHASVAQVELRHGSGAVQLSPLPEHLPRLSIVSLFENGL